MHTQTHKRVRSFYPTYSLVEILLPFEWRDVCRCVSIFGHNLFSHSCGGIGSANKYWSNIVYRSKKQSKWNKRNRNHSANGLYPMPFETLIAIFEFSFFSIFITHSNPCDVRTSQKNWYGLNVFSVRILYTLLKYYTRQKHAHISRIAYEGKWMNVCICTIWIVIKNIKIKLLREKTSHGGYYLVYSIHIYVCVYERTRINLMAIYKCDRFYFILFLLARFSLPYLVIRFGIVAK